MMTGERIDLSAVLSGGRSLSVVAGLVSRIKRGALFVYPTETIYGIGGIAVPAVKERVLRAKRRALENPMIIIAGSFSMLEHVGVVLNEKAARLAEALWPGNITLVVRSPQGGTVGVRVSDHPFLRALVPHVILPLYSTSANVSGEPYVNDPDRIHDLFRDRIDFMIDAGPLPGFLPSTVVDVSQENRVLILREGAVPAVKVHEILGTN